MYFILLKLTCYDMCCIKNMNLNSLHVVAIKIYTENQTLCVLKKVIYPFHVSISERLLRVCIIYT